MYNSSQLLPLFSPAIVTLPSLIISESIHIYINTWHKSLSCPSTRPTHAMSSGWAGACRGDLVVNQRPNGGSWLKKRWLTLIPNVIYKVQIQLNPQFHPLILLLLLRVWHVTKMAKTKQKQKNSKANLNAITVELTKPGKYLYFNTVWLKCNFSYKTKFECLV